VFYVRVTDPARAVGLREVGVLEVGGSHIETGLVRLGAHGRPPSAASVEQASVISRPLDGGASAGTLLDALRAAIADRSLARAGRWALAMPGPFDYERGVGRYAGVGKFDALRGVDVRAALAAALGVAEARIRFANDADAFALGEWAALPVPAGGRRGAERLVGITLGTGVGSGWIADGRPVASGAGVPPGGEIHRMLIDAAPLEDRVSARALLAGYAAASAGGGEQATGGRAMAVAELAERARAGDERARAVFAGAFEALGAVLGPLLGEFGARRLVVGGSIARSWELVEPPLRRGIERTLGVEGAPPIVPAAAEHGALVGAALATA
jgi:glucokinase